MSTDAVGDYRASPALHLQLLLPPKMQDSVGISLKIFPEISFHQTRMDVATFAKILFLLPREVHRFCMIDLRISDSHCMRPMNLAMLSQVNVFTPFDL